MTKCLSKIAFVHLWVIIYVFFAQAALSKELQVRVRYENSEPKYYGMPSENVRDLCSESEYVPLGCTHYNMTYHYDYKTYGINGQYQVTDINMKFYYKDGDFYVYIDDKYPQGSCEYNAIKKHEKLHVKVDQTVEIEKVRAFLQKCISNINRQKTEKSALDETVKSCVQKAFDLDMQIRKKRNIDIDADKNNHPNFQLMCPKY
ncbi:MAG: hypothetical protein J6N49_06835 [Alphaproteobacteria bacterium]|nr:hypothetical protein [Alphaproteobacteria bacterium]